MNTKISTFKYGKFVFPGTQSVGSAGNLFVIPKKGKNPDLAAEFINMLLTKKYQNYLANAGGLALFADADAVANPTSKVTADPFAAIVKKNALGMYPDWPVAGFYPVLLQEGIKLLSDGNVAAYQKAVGDFYNAGKPKA
jgi:raffinose/stachyose/melibiose transport system substrate-binding protein